jgi:hypothetical protein
MNEQQEQEQEQEVIYLVGLQTGAEFLEEQRQKREEMPEEAKRTSE